VVLLVVVAVLL